MRSYGSSYAFFLDSYLKMYLILLSFLPLGFAECPVVKCEELKVKECAVRNGATASINEFGCPKGQTCLISAFNSWFDGTTETLYCVDSPDDTDDPSSNDCGTKPTGEMLAPNNDGVVLHLKECAESTDCVLENGGTSSCECAMDGKRYCQPEWGSEVFDDYWDLCEASNKEVDYAFYSYFKQLQASYVGFLLAPDCARSIFEELQELKTRPDSAYMTGMGVLLMLLGIIG